jgi:pSer/pThr/pTyr-binding forkhead associated (FHA) protein
MILEITYSDTNTHERVTIPRNKCVIGRSSKSDFQIDLECFSRNHFEIEWVEKEFFVKDLNSTNGIYINGERLPTGVRIPFKNFFPIEIGGKVSIAVFSDDSETDNHSQASTVSRGSKVSTDQTQTRTRSVLPRPKAAPAKKSDQSPNSSNVFKVLGLLAVLGGFGYYYYTDNEAQENLQATGQIQVEATNTSSPTIQVSSDELSGLLKSNSCMEFGSLCTDLGLKYANEKIVTTIDKIVIFVNSQEQITQLTSTYMAELPLNEQVEYLLGSFAFNPKIVSEARKNSFKHIVVADIESFDDLSKVRHSLAIETMNSPVLDQETHDRFFSNLFYAGYVRPYKSQLKSFTKFSSH